MGAEESSSCRTVMPSHCHLLLCAIRSEADVPFPPLDASDIAPVKVDNSARCSCLRLVSEPSHALPFFTQCSQSLQIEMPSLGSNRTSTGPSART